MTEGTVLLIVTCPTCHGVTDDVSDELRYGVAMRYCGGCNLVFRPAQRIIPTAAYRADLDG